MRGIDRGDQLESYYNVGRKSKKWWRRIFFYCIDRTVTLFGKKMIHPVEHQSEGEKKRDMLSFRLDLAKELIGSYSSWHRFGRCPRSAEHIQLDRLTSSLGHWPIHTGRKGNCVVYLEQIKKKYLPTAGNRHESVFSVNIVKFICVSLWIETVSSFITQQ